MPSASPLPALTHAPAGSPYHFDGDKMNFNLTQIHSWSTPVRSDARLRSITLPSTRDSWNRVHVFALSVTPSLLSPVPDADKPLLIVRRVRFTTKHASAGGGTIVEVALANLLPEGDDGWLTGRHTVTIDSPLVQTVTPGVVYRLASADEVRVEVVVKPGKRVKPGTTGTATVELRDARGNVIAISKGWAATVPDAKWEANEKSLSNHEAPNWWSDAKFGILCAVPSCTSTLKLTRARQHPLGRVQCPGLGASGCVRGVVLVSMFVPGQLDRVLTSEEQLAHAQPAGRPQLILALPP